MYVFGPFCVDAARRVLTRDGKPVPVTARAFDLLLALLERPGETVDKNRLLDRVWSDAIVEEANLSQQIFTLRRILGHTDDQPFIATVPRRGYRWVAPVVRGGTAAAPTVAAAVAAPAPQSLCLDLAFDPAMRLANTGSVLVAIAPDGGRVVYVAADGDTTRLVVRALDRFELVTLPGTDGAANPFFSPDGRWIGFQQGRRLQKMPVDGGPPLTLTEVADLRGATWTAAGDIVYAPGPTTGLWRVPDRGGAAAPFTTLDFDGGERTHRWPHTLPDGRVIFTIGTAGVASFDEAMLALADAGGRHRVVLQHATDGRCLPDGRLAWARGAALFAAAFDAEQGRVTGTPQMLQHGVAMSATGVAHFACSRSGILLHVAGAAQTLRRSLVNVDRGGVEIARYVSGDSLEEPRLDHAGRTVIVSLRNRSSDLWLYDFSSSVLTRLTFEGENFAGIWGPAPGTITYSASYGGPSDLYLLRPDRSASPELLVASEFDKVAGSWSPDGATLVFTEYHPDSGADLWLLDRATESVRPFIRTRFNEYAPAFSPDGRYVAYVTDESGRAEVMVVAFPDGTGKRQLSAHGGTEPVWSRDGTELFYRSGERLVRVDMRRGMADAGIPTTMFEGRFVPGTVTFANYDVAIDGTSFLMVCADEPPPPHALRVSIGWLPSTG